MRSLLIAVAYVVVASPPVVAAEPAGRYAIVVKKEAADGEWGKVVKFLETKHKAKRFVYTASPEDVLKDVGAYHPRYVCFVCQPTENFPNFALVANKFCRTLDDDPVEALAHARGHGRGDVGVQPGVGEGVQGGGDRTARDDGALGRSGRTGGVDDQRGVLRAARAVVRERAPGRRVHVEAGQPAE